MIFYHLLQTCVAFGDSRSVTVDEDMKNKKKNSSSDGGPTSGLKPYPITFLL